MGSRRFLPLLLFLPLVLNAQGRQKAPPPEGSYYLDESRGPPRFVQRLSWESEDFVSRYELTLERQLARGGYERVLRESTTGLFIELSLSPGKYRYRVQAYDLLNLPAGNPPWLYIEVLPALKPELNALKPLSLTAGSRMHLTVEGRNLVQGGRALLRSRKDGGEIEVRYSAESEGRTGELDLSGTRLPPGEYDVVVVNPGGLSGSAGPVTIVSSSFTREYFFAAGYQPMVSLHGSVNDLLESKIFPLGFSARFGLTAFNWGDFSLGFEAAANWNYLNSKYDGGYLQYDVSGHYGALQFQALFRYKMPGRPFAFTAGAGGGLTAVLNFTKKYSVGTAPPLNVLFGSLGAGVSALWYFHEPFYAELGFEYRCFLSVDEANPHYLFPFIAVGMVF
jgi:hypothetical protein